MKLSECHANDIISLPSSPINPQFLVIKDNGSYDGMYNAVNLTSHQLTKIPLGKEVNFFASLDDARW